VDDDGRVKISVTQTRAKTHNLRRDQRASLHVQGRDRYEYLVAEGTAQFIEGDELPEALRHYYRKVRGEHPDWAEYDAAMVAEQRLLLSISVERAYGQLR
jgi:PPOX class probable F420-dependent enzyme